MQLPVITFSAMLEQMAAGLQGAATQLLDLSIGSVLRALLEACAAVGLWLQWLILQVLSATRAATSQGPDLDSWMADFSFTRIPGALAVGSVTFARYTPGVATAIPVGTVVLTADGTQSFAVTADPTNAAWSSAGYYALAATLASVTVPVEAAAIGAAGNIVAGAIGLLGAPIPGIDTVTNSQPLSGGLAAESDARVRSRFQLYINSRSLATIGAIEEAASSILQVSRYIVLENQNTLGNFQPGNFCVFADDGTGTPSNSLLSEVQSAVNAVRPIGATFSVMGPAVYGACVTVTIETLTPATHLAVTAKVQAAVLAWIAGLPIGGTLAISKIDALAHGADARVVSVTSTLINGSAADLVASANAVIIAQSVTVS